MIGSSLLEITMKFSLKTMLAILAWTFSNEPANILPVPSTTRICLSVRFTINYRLFANLPDMTFEFALESSNAYACSENTVMFTNWCLFGGAVLSSFPTAAFTLAHSEVPKL